MYFFFQSSQVPTESGTNKAEEKVGDGRYSSHHLDEVAAIIRSTISVYEVKASGLPLKLNVVAFFRFLLRMMILE